MLRLVQVYRLEPSRQAFAPQFAFGRFLTPKKISWSAFCTEGAADIAGADNGKSHRINLSI
jgi:hypothetical protein